VWKRVLPRRMSISGPDAMVAMFDITLRQQLYSRSTM
jgi:hypothetical protein